MPRALTMPVCLSRPGDVRIPRAWRCPHTSRLVMSSYLAPGDVLIPRALAMSLHTTFSLLSLSSTFHHHPFPFSPPLLHHLPCLICILKSAMKDKKKVYEANGRVHLSSPPGV
ncbi:hypothetical protein VNO80_15586 [Phaseolus coccineus]|uniref:Uncharacterized protein n=1 Tax=Phaseolus coccineus TaxID=3886 RepID=A0AAN9MQK2_PHACN